MSMNLLEYYGIALLLVVTRVGAFIGTFPLFRSTTIPRIVKVAMTLALSGMWLSSFSLDGIAPLPPMLKDHWLSYGVGILRELVIGGLLGFLLGLFFVPAQLAGAYLGQELGFNMAGVTDPATESSANVFGDLLGALAMLTFLAVDGHHLALGALHQSFVSMPIGEPLPQFSPQLVSQSFADAHRWGMELATPLGTGLFLIGIITLMLMKVSPQLNLFAFGIPARFVLGFCAAIACVPKMISMMSAIFQNQLHFLADMGL